MEYNGSSKKKPVGSPLPEEEWQRRNNELREYVAANPRCTLLDITEEGYMLTLEKFYEGKISKIKESLGIQGRKSRWTIS